jgi:hypothetical protein
MEKTRFYQLTQSELNILRNAILLSCNYFKENKKNLLELLDEIHHQININEWNKTQFETKKRIEELEKELTDLKKLLNK